MADIDAKAQALSAARHRILKLQEEMTDRVLLIIYLIKISGACVNYCNFHFISEA
jgi:hypothetical protein